MAQFQRALKIDPNDSDAINLGNSLAQQGSLTKRPESCSTRCK